MTTYIFYETSALTTNSKILYIAYIIVCLQAAIMFSTGVALTVLFTLTYLIFPLVQVIPIRKYFTQK